MLGTLLVKHHIGEIMATNESQPIMLHEKTAQRVLELSRLLRETQNMIDAIVATLREAHNLPDSWVLQQIGGSIYIVDNTPPQE